MPFEIIGRKSLQRGKTLWEILGNLRNHGIGRIVARTEMELKYSNPSWLRIVDVSTLSPEGKIQVIPPLLDLGEVRRVNVLVDNVVHGKYMGREWMHHETYKPDYKLIPKEEEELYTKVKKGELPDKYINMSIYPSHCAFPPLLRELVISDMRARGESEAEPKLLLTYSEDVNIAKEGETPDVEISPKYIKGTVCPSLYSTVKYS